MNEGNWHENHGDNSRNMKKWMVWSFSARESSDTFQLLWGYHWVENTGIG